MSLIQILLRLDGINIWRSNFMQQHIGLTPYSGMMRNFVTREGSRNQLLIYLKKELFVKTWLKPLVRLRYIRSDEKFLVAQVLLRYQRQYNPVSTNLAIYSFILECFCIFVFYCHIIKYIFVDQWWLVFGTSAPILQKMTIRILSQIGVSLNTSIPRKEID